MSRSARMQIGQRLIMNIAMYYIAMEKISILDFILDIFGLFCVEAYRGSLRFTKINCVDIRHFLVLFGVR
jgi:hypothetical protein